MTPYQALRRWTYGLIRVLVMILVGTAVINLVVLFVSLANDHPHAAVYVAVGIGIALWAWFTGPQSPDEGLWE